MSQDSDDDTLVVPASGADAYVAPALRDLGSLADMTQGGADPSSSDGFGGAGDIGSI